MDKRVRTLPALISLVLIAPSIAGADALCNYDDTVRMDNYLKKGREAEKAGKTRDALLFYRAVDSFCGDGAAAKGSIKRIGLKSGAKAVERGRFISDEGLFTKVADEDCRRWMRYLHIDVNPYEPPVPGHCTTESGGMRLELNPQAGAFDWYEATFNYREADLSLLKLLSKRPGDLFVFERVFSHFQSRKRLNSTGYTPDKAFFDEVEKTAFVNLDSTLSKEEKEYTASRQADRSIKLLHSAIKWATYMGEGTKERVIARAVSRGDHALDAGTPSGLSDALAFFSFAGKEELKTAVLTQANELGRAALEKKDYILAEKFFVVEGNEQMIALARRLSSSQKSGGAVSEMP